jgi:hypothetical protein
MTAARMAGLANRHALHITPTTISNAPDAFLAGRGAGRPRALLGDWFRYCFEHPSKRRTPMRCVALLHPLDVR